MSMVTVDGRGQGTGLDPAGAPPKLPEQLEVIEHALKALHPTGSALVAAPRSTFDLRPAARAVERAVTRALDGYDGRGDVRAALDAAAAASDEARVEIARALTSDEGLAPAGEWLARASGGLRAAATAPATSRAGHPRRL